MIAIKRRTDAMKMEMILMMKSLRNLIVLYRTVMINRTLKTVKVSRIAIPLPSNVIKLSKKTLKQR